uniref:ATP synthase F0 subunit 6 n=1 Tax=Prosthogonimus cuneatus TaxID=232414 RepID=A0A7L7RZH1_9TREM|nr:ATP synthase F0 subunit 6 [Prosthogonimus cuneatus]QNU39792.1 ATP synthase F0 subunit 6 [Prosthogonimus cuneatus]
MGFRFFVLSLLFSSVVGGSKIWGGGFRLVSVFVLLWFIFVRVPFVFDLFDFFLFVLVFVFSLHISAMVSRLEFSVSLFLSSFVPSGVSSFFGLFLCVVETISYLIRPFVLVFRPFLNFVIGGVVGHSLFGSFCYWYRGSFGVFYYLDILYLLGLVGLLFFLFYEWCVSVVQWYIINSFILIESEVH